MSYFKVLLEGENFFVEFDDKQQLLGFVTTRWVRACNEEQAELKAVDLIRRDKHLLKMLVNSQSVNPPPMIYQSDIYQISWFTYTRRQPGTGYSFFPMECEKS